MPTSSKQPAKQPAKAKADKSEVEKALSSEPDSTATETESATTDKQVDSIAGFKITTPGNESKFTKMLVYGESGVGKTVLAGSASKVAEMSPVLHIDIEGGTQSLVDFQHNVEVVRIKTWPEMQRIYDDLVKGKSKYKTVIVDSLTEAQKLSMAHLMGVSTNFIVTDVPQMQEWLKNIEQSRRFVRAFRDLPMNVILTALVDRERDNKNRELIHPKMDGKVAKELPGFFDEVFYMYMKISKDGERKRLLLTGSTDTVQAKDRSNRLPLTVEAPTMEYVYSTIKGNSNNTENTEANSQEGTK